MAATCCIDDLSRTCGPRRDSCLHSDYTLGLSMHLLSNHIWMLFDSIATLLGRTWAEPVGDDRWLFDLSISAPIVFPLMFDCPLSPSPLPVCPQNPTFNWSQIRCYFGIWYRFLPPLSQVRSLRRLGILISGGGWSRSTPNCSKNTRNWRCFFSHSRLCLVWALKDLVVLFCDLSSLFSEKEVLWGGGVERYKRCWSEELSIW